MNDNKEKFRQQIADDFLRVLEEKGLHWKKEWNSSNYEQHNPVSKTVYKGINAFNLELTSLVKGYDDPRWVTMIQIMDKDNKYHPKQEWKLEKGTKATYVEHWYPYDLELRKEITWKEYKEKLNSGIEKDMFRIYSRYFAVFNASCIEGIPPLEIAQKNKEIVSDKIVTTIAKNMGVRITNDGKGSAYYSPFTDSVHLPLASDFTNSYSYNATALHELAHASGHETRLNRTKGKFFGDEDYAYEELIAEMSSCFMSYNLSQEMTDEHFENHKAYIHSWVQSIKENPNILINAVQEAGTCANYLEEMASLEITKNIARQNDRGER